MLAFARLRELLGFGERRVDVADGTTIEDVWTQLAGGSAELAGAARVDALRAQRRAGGRRHAS